MVYVAEMAHVIMVRPAKAVPGIAVSVPIVETGSATAERVLVAVSVIVLAFAKTAN